MLSYLNTTNFTNFSCAKFIDEFYFYLSKHLFCNIIIKYDKNDLGFGRYSNSAANIKLMHLEHYQTTN